MSLSRLMTIFLGPCVVHGAGGHDGWRGAERAVARVAGHRAAHGPPHVVGIQNLVCCVWVCCFWCSAVFVALVLVLLLF